MSKHQRLKRAIRIKQWTALILAALSFVGLFYMNSQYPSGERFGVSGFTAFMIYALFYGLGSFFTDRLALSLTSDDNKVR